MIPNADGTPKPPVQKMGTISAEMAPPFSGQEGGAFYIKGCSWKGGERVVWQKHTLLGGGVLTK